MEMYYDRGFPPRSFFFVLLKCCPGAALCRWVTIGEISPGFSTRIAMSGEVLVAPWVPKDNYL